MRLATVSVQGWVSCAIIAGDDSADLIDYSTAADAIAAEVAKPGTLASATVVRSVESGSYDLLAPLPSPGKIFGSGINYVNHKDENPAAVMPVEPGFFSKFPSSITGPETEVILPAAESQVDYEVELAIVIGKPGKNISRENAYEHVFGYTVVNDISGRDVQFRPNQMDLGKGFDTFCPIGPWIVSADGIDDVNAIQVRSWVNGELRQDSNTSQWIYTVPELIEHASRYLTLNTGDVITTGTPAGCGTFRTPPLWLADGDEVIVEASGVGRLRNTIRQGW